MKTIQANFKSVVLFVFFAFAATTASAQTAATFDSQVDQDQKAALDVACKLCEQLKAGRELDPEMAKLIEAAGGAKAVCGDDMKRPGTVRTRLNDPKSNLTKADFDYIGILDDSF